MNIRHLAPVVLAGALALSGCEGVHLTGAPPAMPRPPVGQQPPAAGPATMNPQQEKAQWNVAMAERSDESQGLWSSQDRSAARKAATEYTLKTLPGATVRGIAATPVNGNLYIAQVDIAADGREAPLVEVAVRRFFAPDGSSYWRADPISDATRRLMDAAPATAEPDRTPEPAPGDAAVGQPEPG